MSETIPAADPPTQEAPTVPLAPPDPEEVRPDEEIRLNIDYPGPPEDPGMFILNQLKAEAADRNRPDMVGLEWRDENGLLHKVTSHDVIEKGGMESKKTVLPRPVIRSHIRGGPTIQRLTKYTDKKEVLDCWTVDVINPIDDLVDVVGHTGEKSFANYFNAYYASTNSTVLGYDVPRKITDVRLRENVDDVVEHEPAGPVELNEAVPLDGSRVSFYNIAEQQIELGLDDWNGLTWTDHQGNEKKIIRDMTVYKSDDVRIQEYPDRVFEVRTHNRSGVTINRHLYSITELKHHFGSRDKLYPDAPPPDLHWERHTARNATDSETATGTNISLETVYIMLSDPKLYDTETEEGREALSAAADNLSRQPMMQKYAHMLQETLAEIGGDKFTEVVRKLHDDFNKDIRRLGLMASAEDRLSRSWLLEDLMKQRYYKKHPEEASRDGYSGYIGDPFEDSAHGRMLRSRPTALRLGKKFSEAAQIVGDPVPKPQIERTEKGLVIDDKIVVIPYKENADLTQRLRTFLYGERIRVLALKRQTIDDPELTQAELEGIGVMAQWSFGSN